MTRTGSCPSDADLQACVDGQLDAPKAQLIREHAAGCTSCAAALREYEQLHALIEGHALEAGSSLWPAVQQRVRGQRDETAHPAVSGWSRLAVSLGSAVAVAAGLMIGFFLVPWQEATTGDLAWQQDTWTEMGSLLADPSTYGSLDGVYWEFVTDSPEAASGTTEAEATP